ncbi:MAG: ABC transporter ATP-binding protein [Candidatus Aminicenantales bacterium]|jgi:iron complex transport system ATP-binding protein
MAILEVKNLSAGYDGGFVIKDISLALEPGEFVAVLGRNGSGKSTLIRAMMGLLGNVRGEVVLDGDDLFRLGRREIARKIAYVPQLAEPIFEFTAREVVLMGRYARQSRFETLSAGDANAVDEAVCLTETASLLGKKVGHLSGGERQRVFIARALAQDTPILFLDEPSLHLDISYQVEIYAILKGLQKDKAKTILAAEHNINLAAAHAERLVHLKDGGIAAQGGPAETITANMVRAIFEAEVDVKPNSRSGLPEISLVTGGKGR